MIIRKKSFVKIECQKEELKISYENDKVLIKGEKKRIESKKI